VILPDLSFSSWAGIVAAGAVIGSCWRTISVWITRAADLVIGRVLVKDDAARAMMAHVWRYGARSPLGLRAFGGITTHVASKQRVELVPFEAIISEPRLVWLGRVPVLVQSGLNNDAHDKVNMGNQIGNTFPVMMYYLRGTLDIETLIEGAVHEYNDLRQRAGEGATDKHGDLIPAPKRFNIIRMHGPGAGEGGSHKEGGDKATPIGRYSGGSSSGDEILRQLQREELRVLSGWKATDLVPRPTDATKPFDHHPVAPNILAHLRDIGPWLAHEKWFRSRGIGWYMGFLLHGPSGSGKSTIVRNVALQHDLPVYTFDLSSYDNNSFTNDWKQVMQNVPAIVLLEDIDCTFDKRENLAVRGKQRDGLTFDCLLNTLSGVGSTDGILLFVTTNHLESLDPALGIPDAHTGKSTRPGRINRALYIGEMAEPERRIVASHILSDYPDLIEPSVAAGAGEVAAQFQERCARLALDRWNAGDRPAKVEPPDAKVVPSASVEPYHDNLDEILHEYR